MKKCPYCAEEIQDEAVKCRFCGEILSKQGTVFSYHTKDKNGEYKDGTIEALNQDDALDKLNAQGLCVISIKLNGGAEKPKITGSHPTLEPFHDEKKRTDENEPVTKIRSNVGCFSLILCLIIPGLGMFLRGRIVAGIIYLILAIVFGIPTFGIAIIILAIISALHAGLFSPVCKCPKCKETVQSGATICKSCHTQLK